MKVIGLQWVLSSVQLSNYLLQGLQEYRYVFHSVKSLMIQAAEALGEIYDNYTVYGMCPLQLLISL